MGFPMLRRYFEDEIYVWRTNVLQPLPPLPAKQTSVNFEDLKTHPSGIVKGVSSVGTTAEKSPSPYLIFPIDLDVSIEEMESLRSFFIDGGFWLYPDSDEDEGFLVTYSPNEFRPAPLSSGRFLIQGQLIQIGNQVAPTDTVTTTLQIPHLSYSQQFRANAALSLANNETYFTFPRPESDTSDWTLLDAHVVKHQTQYADRHGRILFSWVRSVKRIYRLDFVGVTSDFVDLLLVCVGRRKTRFYPHIGSGVNAETPVAIDTVYPYIDVRVIEQQLNMIYDQGYYTTSITLEEI